MTGSGFALLAYPPSPNFRGIANWPGARSTELVAKHGGDSAPELATPRQPSAQCAAAGAGANTIIVVVTY